MGNPFYYWTTILKIDFKFSKTYCYEKTILYLFLSLVLCKQWTQTRGTKLGFIDMEYILQNVPDYTEAKAQLELKLKMET
jgi:hypothetical protein